MTRHYAVHSTARRAARTSLGLIDLTGALMTGDALHCQGETARLIKARDRDWLFTLKANRPLQHAKVRAWFADPASRPDSEHTATDADNGRIEVRRHVVSHDVGWLLSDRRHLDEAPMPGLAMLGMVEATVTRDGKTTTVRRHYLSSAEMDAARFAAAVRAHWRIENCLYWPQRREVFRPVLSPVSGAILVEADIKNLRTTRPDISIRRKCKRCGWSDTFARSVLRQMR